MTVSFERKKFSGSLSLASDSVPIDFYVECDEAADICISFERFEYADKYRFIRDAFNVQSTRFAEFTLVGTADDGTTFECDDVMFTALGNVFHFEEGLFWQPKCTASLARITLDKPEAIDNPILRWRLKGFGSYAVLESTCEFGRVGMAGIREKSKLNEISGQLFVEPSAGMLLRPEWKSQAEALLDHVRLVMSFATGTYIQVPVREIAILKKVVVTLYAQGVPKMSDMPNFNHLTLQDIFECSVKSFFEPHVHIKNLVFAVTWFVMQTNYSEGMLINSMTVVENLVGSNLDDEDVYILTPKRYEKLRKKLSAEIKADLAEWVTDIGEQASLVSEFNERLVDLRRRSLMDKIILLSQRWGVHLDDIRLDELQEAKKARDHVVHRGYYRSPVDDGDDLHDHLLIVREVIVRFVLTALGYKGTYWSYRGGYHSRRLGPDGNHANGY